MAIAITEEEARFLISVLTAWDSGGYARELGESIQQRLRTSEAPRCACCGQDESSCPCRIEEVYVEDYECGSFYETGCWTHKCRV